MNDRELVQAALEKVQATITEVERIYRKRGPMPKIQIDFGLRGVRAGEAHGTKKIRLNMAHLRAETEHMLNQTIPHEVAHCAAAHYFSARGHGPQWQGIMLALGLEPERCYQYEGERFKTRTVPKPFIYVCACSEHRLTATKHRRHAKRKYYCVTCKETLRYKGSDNDLTLGDLDL